jgi:Protein of unknown function (DUF3667)
MQDGCLNCGGTLMPGQHYCPVCGQKATVRRLSIRQLAQDFVIVVINIEKGIVRLLKGLTFAPAKVAIEYVDGKRRKYFSPFAFMTLCIASTVIINNWARPWETKYEPDQKVLARIYDEPTREKYIRTVERNAWIQGVANKNLSTVSVLVAPYYALFLWWFFRRRNRNFAEIIIAYLLFAAYSTLVSTVLFSPLMGWTRDSSAYYYVQGTSFILQTVYMAWGMKGFFGLKTTGGYLKMLGALSLIGIIGFILLLVGTFLYVFYGAYDVLKYL